MQVVQRELTLVAMLGVVLTLLASPAAANVVVTNGSFEDPAVWLHGETWTSELTFGDVPTGWTPISGMGTILHRPNPSGLNLYAQPTDGTTLLGLEENSGGTALYGVQQDIGTMTTGKLYTFNATLFSNHEGSASSYRISLYNVTDNRELAAITQANFDPSALGLNKTVAASFHYAATAADNGDTVRLILAPNSGPANYRTGVDAVSVTETNGLIHKWTFNDGTARDSVGNANGTLINAPTIQNGSLVLNSGGDQGQYMITSSFGQALGERTAMVWVKLSNLSQPGGAGALGVQVPGQTIPNDNFDSIVYGERTTGQWMNGSNGWQRSVVNNGGAAESSTGEVMMTAVYGADNSIKLYRNGQLYSTLGASQGTLVTRADPIAILGRRVDISSPSLQGSIDEARIYNYAMSDAEVLAAWNGGNAPSGLLHRWSFNDGTAKDSVGGANGTLFGGATISGGALHLDGISGYMRTTSISETITAKTLVAWVSLDNLLQKSGGVLTLENPTHDNNETFDSITYAERTNNQWMSGSNGWARSNGTSNGGAAETTTAEVMMAITYGTDGSITLYRNGVYYASYTAGGPISYTNGFADVVFGLRHELRSGDVGSATGDDAFLAGLIDEARIYDYAMSAADISQLNALGPNILVPEPSTLVLLATGLLGLLAYAWRRRK